MAQSVEEFRHILDGTTKDLNRLCECWSKILENHPYEDPDQEDFAGAIRTTIGQAKLLMSQRFKQFNDLIDHCENNTGQHPTTLNDLSGFWEMISYQVTDVIKKFKTLDARKGDVA